MRDTHSNKINNQRENTGAHIYAYTSCPMCETQEQQEHISKWDKKKDKQSVVHITVEKRYGKSVQGDKQKRSDQMKYLEAMLE